MRGKARRVLRPYLDSGYTLQRCHKHYILRHPNGGTLVIPKSGSDRRGGKNGAAMARRVARG